MSEVHLTATFIRRSTGVEVSVTGEPEAAAEKFEELCQAFDEFPGYDPKRYVKPEKEAANMKRVYAIRNAIAARKSKS